MGKTLAARIGNYLWSGAWRSLLLQVMATALVLLSSVVVARLSGAEGFGIYTLVFTWVTLLSISATLGLDDLLLKEVPQRAAKQQYASLHLLLRWSNRLGLRSALLTALCFALFFYLTPSFAAYRSFFFLGLLCVPLFTLLHINQAALRGFQRMGRGQLAEKLVQPLGFLLLVGLSYFWGLQVDDAQLIGYRVLSFLPASALAFYWLYRHRKKFPQPPLSEQDALLPKKWWKASRYFGYMSLLMVIKNRVDLVLLGWLSLPEQVAYFNVASKFSDIIMLPFMILTTVVTPLFSKFYSQGQLGDLQQLYRRISRVIFLLVALGALFCLFFGKWLMGWYGGEFVQGYGLLLLLCGGKLLHAFFGPANYLLLMTDTERECSKAMSWGVALSISLHLLLIPAYGIWGAGIAHIAGFFLSDLLLVRLAYKKLGLRLYIWG